MALGADGGVSGQSTSGAYEGSFRALLANVADMVTITARDGRIVYGSPATESVSGYTPEEFMDRDPFASIHPEDRPRCVAAFEKLAKTPGLSLDLEHRVRHKNGEWHWVEGTFASLFDDPDVGGLVATVRDITGRKRAEEQSRRAADADAFRVALADALASLMEPGEIQAARVLSEHLGASRVMYAEVEDDENGNPALAVVARGYASDARPLTGRFRMADFGLTRADGPVEKAVVTNVMADPSLTGEEKARYAGANIGAWVGVPLVKGDRFVAALGVHQSAPRDWRRHEVALVEETAERTWAAVERARAERALRESEGRLKEAISIETVGVNFFDLFGRITDSNEAFARMTGFSRDELRDLVSWEDLTPPEFETVTARAVEELAARGETAPFEKQMFCKDGSRWWGLCAPRRLSGSGRESQCVEFVIDITERKRLEAERARSRTREAAMRAETAERERISRELHDRVAHSMGIAYQNLQLHRVLAESDPERAGEKLALAEETTRRALNQTRNLAIELRRSVVEETENGIATALSTLIETTVPDDVDAKFSYSGDESLVPRDVGVQVYLIMREAVRNALKHSEGDEIEARLQIQPGEVVGTVTDDGEGFDPEPASGEAYRAGIGLRSMREPAEMVGGELILTSRPGDGTAIEIRVPLRDRPDSGRD
jgi:PAS domain S-box-containing protein